MLPTIEEMQEFVKEIPPTAEGKLKAMNKLFSREKDPAKAFGQISLFFQDLIKNNPDYLEAIRNCRTEEEIKQATTKFYADNPKMAEETLLSMLAVKRDQWEEQEKKKKGNQE